MVDLVRWRWIVICPLPQEILTIGAAIEWSTTSPWNPSDLSSLVSCRISLHSTSWSYLLTLKIIQPFEVRQIWVRVVDKIVDAVGVQTAWKWKLLLSSFGVRLLWRDHWSPEVLETPPATVKQRQRTTRAFYCNTSWLFLVISRVPEKDWWRLGWSDSQRTLTRNESCPWQSTSQNSALPREAAVEFVCIMLFSLPCTFINRSGFLEQ